MLDTSWREAEIPPFYPAIALSDGGSLWRPSSVAGTAEGGTAEVTLVRHSLRRRRKEKRTNECGTQIQT
jgi:hypothetical protein